LKKVRFGEYSGQDMGVPRHFTGMSTVHILNGHNCSCVLQHATKHFEFLSMMKVSFLHVIQFLLNELFKLLRSFVFSVYMEHVYTHLYI